MGKDHRLGVKKLLSSDEIIAGIVLLDTFLFTMKFYSDELTEPMSKEQKMLLLDISKSVLASTGRQIGKSLFLDSFLTHILVTHITPSGRVDEGIFWTPADKHMRQDLDRIIPRIQRSPLLNSLIKIRDGENQMLEGQCLRIYCRIEGHDGRPTNMVGPRCKYLVGDEAQLGNEPCDRARFLHPGGMQRQYGVPDGVRERPFYRKDMTNLGARWSRHKYPTFINPIFKSDDQRQDLIDQFGGVESQAYKNNVLGEWGDEMLSSFPPGALSVLSQSIPYFVRTIQNIDSSSNSENIALMLNIPSHRCRRFAIGWDYGYSPDPGVFIVLCQETDEDSWRTYCRVEMYRVAPAHQRAIARHLYGKVMDGVFVGLGSDNVAEINNLQSEDLQNAHKFIATQPGASTAISVQTGQPLFDGAQAEREDKTVPNKQLWMETLKTWMINSVQSLIGRKLSLGYDLALVNELLSTTERKTPGGHIQYFGPADPNNRKGMLDHNTEALRYGVATILIAGPNIDESDSNEMLTAEMGWGGDEDNGWRPPYGEAPSSYRR